MFIIFLLVLENWLKKSLFWNRICVRFIIGILDSSMEYVSEGLLKIVDDFFLIFKFFGDLVFINFKFKYLLIFKFLLMRSYFNMNVFYNIIGYLFGCKYRYLLVEVLYIFFDIWGDRSVIKYIIYD